MQDLNTWFERGLCRMESVCNSLSKTCKSMIVAESPIKVQTFGPFGATGRVLGQQAVGLGKFSVETDRQALGPPLRQLIEWRKQQALAEGDVCFFRYLHCMAAQLLHSHQRHRPITTSAHTLLACMLTQGCPPSTTAHVQASAAAPSPP